MSAGLIWGPCWQVNRAALPKGPEPRHSGAHRANAGRPAQQTSERRVPPMTLCRRGREAVIAGASLSQGGSAAMRWLLFMLALPGALAVGFFGVLGLF